MQGMASLDGGLHSLSAFCFSSVILVVKCIVYTKSFRPISLGGVIQRSTPPLFTVTAVPRLFKILVF